MRLLKLLERAVQELVKEEIRFAICGGIAASFYRRDPRTTDDVHIAIVASDHQSSQEVAEKVVRLLGLKDYLGWIPFAEERMPNGVPLILGRSPDELPIQQKIDFLLPAFPWLERAVVRAQFNKLDFGFALLPVITPEDLIIAKLFALALAPDRFQDLDDLKSIFTADNKLDLSYIRSEMTRLNLEIPEMISAIAPQSLRLKV